MPWTARHYPPLHWNTWPALQWLTESIFIGTGARFPDRVLISLYRVA